MAGGNNGTASVNVGNINSSGTTGGDVQVVSMDASSMSTTIGSITTQAAGAAELGGSVGIASRGALTIGGAINTTNTSVTATSPARSGSVFLSSATSINYTSISAWNSGNGSGSGSVILVSAGNSSSITPAPTANPSPPPSFLPANTTVAAGMSGAFTGVPTSGTITTTTTITVSPTSISNYNPAGYSTFSGSGYTVTVDTGSDSRLIAPIMALSTVPNVTWAKPSGHTVSGDAITVVARSGMPQFHNSVNTSGTTSGGSLTFMTIAGDITTSGGTLSYNASGGTTGGNIIFATPLGQVTLPFNSGGMLASGSAQAGNITLVGGTGLRISGDLNTSSASGSGNVTMVAGLGNIVFVNPGGASSSSLITTDSTTGKAGYINLIVGLSVLNSTDDGAGIYQMQGNRGIMTASTTSGQAGNIYLSVITGNNQANGLGCCGIASGKFNLVTTSTNTNGGNVTVAVGGSDQNFRLTDVSGANGGSINVFAGRGYISGNSTLTSPGEPMKANAGVDGQSGNIRVTSTTGNIAFSGGAFSNTTNYIEALGGARGGDITFLAAGGSLSFNGSNNNSSTFNDNIASTGSIQGGDISLYSAGSVTFSTGINTSSSLRNAGDVTIGINTGRIV